MRTAVSRHARADAHANRLDQTPTSSAVGVSSAPSAKADPVHRIHCRTRRHDRSAEWRKPHPSSGRPTPVPHTTEGSSWGLHSTIAAVHDRVLSVCLRSIDERNRRILRRLNKLSRAQEVTGPPGRRIRRHRSTRDSLDTRYRESRAGPAGRARVAEKCVPSREVRSRYSDACALKRGRMGVESVRRAIDRAVPEDDAETGGTKGD